VRNGHAAATRPAHVPLVLIEFNLTLIDRGRLLQRGLHRRNNALYLVHLRIGNVRLVRLGMRRRSLLLCDLLPVRSRKNTCLNVLIEGRAGCVRVSRLWLAHVQVQLFKVGLLSSGGKLNLLCAENSGFDGRSLHVLRLFLLHLQFHGLLVQFWGSPIVFYADFPM